MKGFLSLQASASHVVKSGRERRREPPAQPTPPAAGTAPRHAQGQVLQLPAQPRAAGARCGRVCAQHECVRVCAYVWVCTHEPPKGCPGHGHEAAGLCRCHRCRCCRCRCPGAGLTRGVLQRGAGSPPGEGRPVPGVVGHRRAVRPLPAAALRGDRAVLGPPGTPCIPSLGASRGCLGATRGVQGCSPGLCSPAEAGGGRSRPPRPAPPRWRHRSGRRAGPPRPAAPPRCAPRPGGCWSRSAGRRPAAGRAASAWPPPPQEEGGGSSAGAVGTRGRWCLAPQPWRTAPVPPRCHPVR